MAEGKFNPSPELDRLIPPPGEREPAKPSEDVRMEGYGNKPVNLFTATWLRGPGDDKKEE